MIRGMRKSFAICAAIAPLLALAASADEPAESGWYAGGAAQLVLPQGGSRMRRLGGGAARAGRYLTDSLALECEAAWLEDSAALAARAVWHLHGWEEFDMLFGYERLDPFLSAGAKGWIHDGQVGPSAGLGAFDLRHLDMIMTYEGIAPVDLPVLFPEFILFCHHPNASFQNHAV